VDSPGTSNLIAALMTIALPGSVAVAAVYASALSRRRPLDLPQAWLAAILAAGACAGMLYLHRVGAAASATAAAADVEMWVSRVVSE
jgi:hypothetical protein